MSNELTKREWMTAKEAARVLKVTERMVNHYGHNGQIRTQRKPPRGPSWQLILALVIALIIALVILAIVAKVF